MMRVARPGMAPKRHRRELLLAGVALALIAGCGRKGDLEPPPEEPAPQQTPPQQTPPSAPPAGAP